MSTEQVLALRALDLEIEAWGIIFHEKFKWNEINLTEQLRA